KFTLDGEILHVFGLRLLLSRNGAIDLSLAEVVEDGKRYIDDLSAANRLQTDPFSATRYDGYGGLGIHENNTPEYNDLFRYLKDARQKAFEDTFSTKSQLVLETLKADAQHFYHLICHSGEGGGEFANIPVLAKLDPNE